MTLDEALEILKSIEILSFRDKKRKYFMRDVWKAQKVAIKALEQQPCKECVSREDILKCFKEIKFYINHKGMRVVQLVDVIDCVLDAPSVQLQRKKGHWKEFDTTFGRNIYYCTACGRSIEILYKYDFCPLCGADMREVEA